MTQQTSRRDFLKTSTAAVAGAALATHLSAPAVHAASSDVLKVGLIGCGRRGSDAATQAMKADKNVKLVAMADMFPDRLQQSRKSLGNGEFGDKFAVKDEACFTGFDSYKQLIDSGVDVVLLCEPPHFRPAHFKYAIEKNKHVFCEKPVAVDAPGVRSVLATCEEAKKKNLAVVSGLCWRYDLPKRETMKRVMDGTIGDITALQCTYNTGTLWSYPRESKWSDMEFQLRNWLYFTWLSGDFNVEQHIHSLDKMAWVMKDEPPVKCVGMGGRQVRTSEQFGHVYDHMSVVYEYANGVKLFASCRQMKDCASDVSDHIFGTKGRCDVMKGMITGENPWKYKGPAPSMYQQEHNELFASIREGKPLHNGDYMCKSTLLAIMGRMACYTGSAITWDMAMNSKEDLTPAKYELGALPTAPVAMPGVTKFS
ncbi:MAG: Gfo/Idh/MocA family oxidoreductase [Gemmataceae bacterium]|nr:Gfo/Idh/MocA family oxidoreductase [Gemmataceae bacterium]